MASGTPGWDFQNTIDLHSVGMRAYSYSSLSLSFSTPLSNRQRNEL